MAAEIRKKMPGEEELRELRRELAKKNPIWGKVNRIEPRLRTVLAELEAFSKEIDSFLSDSGLVLNKKTIESFQEAKDGATGSLGMIKFILGEIEERREPRPG